MTQTVPDISPLMPMHQDPLLVWAFRNKLSWNLNEISYIFIKENALKMLSLKWQPFCLTLNGVTHRGLNKMTGLLWMIFLNKFSCMKIQLKFDDDLALLGAGPVNSLWPSDAIWRQKSGSTLTQVMACCLKVPSHYLNQCWLIISKVQWHSY